MVSEVDAVRIEVVKRPDRSPLGFFDPHCVVRSGLQDPTAWTSL